MNEHDRDLLEIARERRGRLNPDQFRAWLRGFLMLGGESEELKAELEKLKQPEE